MSHVNAFLTRLTTQFLEYYGLFWTECGAIKEFPKVQEKERLKLLTFWDTGLWWEGDLVSARTLFLTIA